MTYRLIICEVEWLIVRDGREIMGGSLDTLADARLACAELNEETI